uniref:Uncharacterized protein n=1 Tax=Arundo donax TaxID=35708 RepID=A0A0A8YG18_ARUDO
MSGGMSQSPNKIKSSLISQAVQICISSRGKWEETGKLSEVVR